MFDRADITDTELYREVHRHFERWLTPSFGRPHGLADADVHPTQDQVVVSASVIEQLEGEDLSRIAIADADALRVVTNGPNSDRSPRYSPDGRTIAFLSDRREKGVFQAYLLRPELGEAEFTAEVDGVVEYLDWSPDGTRLLLGVAGRGADQAGGQGSGTVGGDPVGDGPEWAPTVTTSAASDQEWRSVWVYDLEDAHARCVSPAGLNVWEATWAGLDRVVAVCSAGDPREGAWYTADLRLLEVASGATRVLFEPRDQIGVPAGDPTGTRVAVVEAVCSDRGIVAGELRVVDVSSGDAETIEVHGTDVADVQWLDDARLGYAGLRGLETVHGIIDLATGKVEETWITTETSGLRYPQARWRPDRSFAVTFDSYTRPPSLAVVRNGVPQVLQSLDDEGTAYLADRAGRLESVTWEATDGLEIQGLLALPDAAGPVPLIVMIHGGPVWAYRNRWTMGSDLGPLLVSSGYAVLYPNPRGSSGRGVEFARLVEGDMGGADTHDYLTGIDALAERGVIDPDRVGVTGGSYGGFMSAWLITQDQRFKAAVPMAPVTDWYSQHHTSNIPHFDAQFLDGQPRAANGLAHARSPVMYADRVVTPTLQTTGGDDRCTPPTQAIEFHTALSENGVESVCCIYPGEGHGVSKFPARIDHAARVLGWFRTHMPVGS